MPGVYGQDPTTGSLWERAKNVLLDGLWTPSGGVARHEGGSFPLLAKDGDGCRLIDNDGITYVDWVMGMGPLILGYRHPAVCQALREAADRGPIWSLMHPSLVELAEELCATIPSGESVVFGRNGSDVLTVAVRAARALTGREVVLVHGYHGFHDWFMASKPSCRGIPARLRELVVEFRYNDLDQVRGLFDRLESKIAAVVMEPITVAPPEPGFLEGIRELTSANGSLLVFDENVTAFRLARGSTQEVFGVEPDLVCLGKSVANGMAVSAVLGKRALGERAGDIGYGLRPDAVATAVARACLAVCREQPVTEHITKVGAAIQESFDTAASHHGVRGRLMGPPGRCFSVFDSVGSLTGHGLKTLFVQECTRHGVLTNGNFLPSFAHDDDAVETTGRVFDKAIRTLALAVEADSLDGFLRVPGLNTG